ncbi:MAG: ABC-2 transporter permease [Coprobacillus sp.]
MMGLLIKDFKLLKGQRNMLFMMVAIAACFVATGNDITFIMSYLTFIATFFVTSTISYDEYNKSNVFLLTLPVTRKEYAKEKYILGFIVCISIWLLTTIACTVYKFNAQGQFVLTEWLQTAILILCIPMFLLSFMIPTQIKYGGEKGRIAMIAVIGIVFVIGFAIYMLCQYLNIDINAIIADISNLQVVLFGVLATLLALLTSYFVTLKVMHNKQF